MTHWIHGFLPPPLGRGEGLDAPNPSPNGRGGKHHCVQVYRGRSAWAFVWIPGEPTSKLQLRRLFFEPYIELDRSIPAEVGNGLNSAGAISDQICSLVVHLLVVLSVVFAHQPG